MTIHIGKITGGTPSSVRNMAKHLLNNTLTPEHALAAAMLAEPYRFVREFENARYTQDFLNNALPRGEDIDLARLAEHAALHPDGSALAREIEAKIADDVDVAAHRLTHPPLSAEARQLHGLGPEVPAPFWLAGFDTSADVRAFGKRTFDQFTEAITHAEYQHDIRLNGSDLSAPLGIVRQDTHPSVTLGLGIDVFRRLDEQQISALMAGRRVDGEIIPGKHYATERTAKPNPRTGERRVYHPVGSVDFVPSPDKSVSVAWAFANPVEQAQILAAHTEAAREAMAYIAQEIGNRGLGHNRRGGEEAGHITWVEFTHHTGRRVAVKVENNEIVVEKSPRERGDPGLHTHFVVPNAVFCPSGAVGSLNLSAMHGFVKEATQFYHARLATLLHEKGFATGISKVGHATLPAVPEAANEHFSKRRTSSIRLAQKYTSDRGEVWDHLADSQRLKRINIATQMLDQKRYGGKDDLADFADWKRQAAAIGWTPPRSFLFVGPEPPPLSREQMMEQVNQIAQQHIAKKLEYDAVLPHYDIRMAILKGFTETASIAKIDDVDRITEKMRKTTILQYGEQTPLIWGLLPDKGHVSVTTKLHADSERELIGLMKSARADRSRDLTKGQIDYQINRSGLDLSGDHGTAQRRVIEHLGRGGKFSLTIAAAGSGKTTALKPNVKAWERQGRDVWGASLARRRATELSDAGIAPQRTKAIGPLVEAVVNRGIVLDQKSVVVVDEFAMLGTRQGLQLFRLREKYGFTIVALADDKQVSSIEAGNITELAGRALGRENIPTINTTKRQQSDREKKIAGLFRKGEAGEALAMKRADGTAEMVPGGRDGVIRRTAQLYADQVVKHGIEPSISVPANEDVHQIGVAIHKQRQHLGLVTLDRQQGRSVQATDGKNDYYMEIMPGDKLRLFAPTYANMGGKRGSIIGVNGSVLDVLTVGTEGMRVRNQKGIEGMLRWSNIAHTEPNRMKIGYGYALTIHTMQGDTSKHSITALPDGSQSISGKPGYSALTRHELTNTLVTNETAEMLAVRTNRPIDSRHEITTDDKWAVVARNLAWQPEKLTATSMIEQAVKLRQGGVALMQAFARPPDPDKPHSQAQEIRDRVHFGWARDAFARTVTLVRERFIER